MMCILSLKMQKIKTKNFSTSYKNACQNWRVKTGDA